jgi:uncharacterized protein (TIGR00296 family)
MSFDLTIDDGAFLVDFARRSIEKYLQTRRKLHVPADLPSKFKEKCGVFVTLNTVSSGAKMLRGCIGYPDPVMPLIEALRDSAISAAVADPRFHPVSYDELDGIEIEVSVLTPPVLLKVEKPLDYPSKIEVGRHGLIVEMGWYKGLLLPQVPVEYNWDAEEFLSETCMKAGLSPDAWVLPGTNVYTFEAIIFAEEKPRGRVIRVNLSSCK